MATTDLIDRDTELKPYLGIETGSNNKNTLLDLLNDTVRTMIESWLGRDLVSRGAITEYHSVFGAYSRIYVTRPPILTVTTVHEDSGRTFGASSLLTVTTDYTVSKPSGKLIRVDSSLETSWLTGRRAIKVVYTGGYAATANVPADIKYEAQRIAGAMWSESTSKQFNMSSVADEMGNVTRFVPPGINADTARVLGPYRLDEQAPTGEVDA